MERELRYQAAAPIKLAPKPAIDVIMFSRRHGLSEDMARRIISISRNGDQARSIAELMK